ncbi:MAG: hypothetical protein JWN44_6335, partial [Myxococcales bacterium]|nr:hypothetical protein [Myxococcales bacterium]
MRGRLRGGVGIALIVAGVTVAATARALPVVGGALPRVEVDDVAAAKRRPLPDARPVLVMYEDQDAQKQNEHARQV